MFAMAFCASMRTNLPSVSAANSVVTGREKMLFIQYRATPF